MGGEVVCFRRRRSMQGRNQNGLRRHLSGLGIDEGFVRAFGQLEIILFCGEGVHEFSREKISRNFSHAKKYFHGFSLSRQQLSCGNFLCGFHSYHPINSNNSAQERSHLLFFHQPLADQ
ncbi:MAG: hypothetical protein NTZ39_02080 [Methanoregula sp.]|nr:hypothetical protein [Methanoregula sp.]